jgi:hypothetical protein
MIDLLFLPGNYKASASISFDFETSAQSPPISSKTRFKTVVLRTGNFLGIIQRDLSGRYGHGYTNRRGAEKVLELFRKMNIHGTWFSTGHVLLKGNRNKNAFRLNMRLPYATSDAGFTSATTWRNSRNSFCHEPFSDYRHAPNYYLGDLAEKMRHEGEDIQCHTFTHPYVAMDTPENLKTDLEDWQNTAILNGFSPSNIFAFPFLGDYYVRTGNKNFMPAKVNDEGEKVFISDNHLRSFQKNGFELFTRCGSLNDKADFSGFKPYHNSCIYCMKDKGILSFNNTKEFDLYLTRIVEQKATIDFWLHPNDVYYNPQFLVFRDFVEQLYNRYDKGEIWLTTVKDQWERFKQIRQIDFKVIEISDGNVMLSISNNSEKLIKQLSFELKADAILEETADSKINAGRLILDKIPAKSVIEIKLKLLD